MRSGLLERGLQLPTLNEPAQDLVRVLVGIGAEQGLRVEPAKRVTHQHPPDRHDGQSSMAPDRGAGAQVNGALAPAYQPGTSACCQTVPASMSTWDKFGSRLPLVRGRPTVPGRRGGAGS